MTSEIATHDAGTAVANSVQEGFSLLGELSRQEEA